MVCHVRLISREDIPQVTELDREAFPTQLPPANYYHELDNRLARYIVVTSDSIKDNTEAKAPPTGFSLLASKLKHVFNNYDEAPPAREYILGFAGFWIMADEAHITSIAVREKYRTRGIGEFLLIVLIELAAEVGASQVTLEVRASNIPAQRLYFKYGFRNVGIRPGYYTDNAEDAIIMTLENITSDEMKAKLKELKQAHSQRWGVTGYQIAGREAKARRGS